MFKNTFKQDLELWEKFERFVAKVLWIKFDIKVKKNVNVEWCDLVWDFNIECKYDRLWKSTGNYFIEFWYKWFASWLLKYKECNFICIGDENLFWVYNIEVLKLYLSNKWRIVNWWDWNKSTWFLIKVDDLIEIATYKFKRK